MIMRNCRAPLKSSCCNQRGRKDFFSDTDLSVHSGMWVDRWAARAHHLVSNGIFIDGYQPHVTFAPPPSLSLSPAQDPHQSGLQQHRHSGGSQEKRLSAELGETTLEKQRHSTAELTAATHPCYERIAARSSGRSFKGPILYQASSQTLPVKTSALL